jgi:hypothetical protein
MHPLMGCALTHPESAALYYLEHRGFEVDQDEEQPIFRRRSGAVLVHGKPVGRLGFPSSCHALRCALERGRKGRGEERKLVKGQIGHILRTLRGGPARR